MSTRSLICLKKENFYEIIYCHWDGDPEYNGFILKNYYTDENKIQELIELGYISSLGINIGEKHHFDARSFDYVTAYQRDRGDEYINPKLFSSFEDLMEFAPGVGAEYVYIFENGEWSCYDGYKKNVISIPEKSKYFSISTLSETSNTYNTSNSIGRPGYTGYYGKSGYNRS